MYLEIEEIIALNFIIGQSLYNHFVCVLFHLFFISGEKSGTQSCGILIWNIVEDWKYTETIASLHVKTKPHKLSICVLFYI